MKRGCQMSDVRACIASRRDLVTSPHLSPPFPSTCGYVYVHAYCLLWPTSTASCVSEITFLSPLHLHMSLHIHRSRSWRLHTYACRLSKLLPTTYPSPSAWAWDPCPSNVVCSYPYPCLPHVGLVSSSVACCLRRSYIINVLMLYRIPTCPMPL